MIGLNKIGLNQVQLNRLRLNAPFPAYGKMAGGGGSGDGFPQLPGDVTRWHFGGLTNEMMAAMDDPRIEDVDHKGRFLSFKNFAWGGMSGVGGYTENYNSNKWYKAESRIDATWTYKSFNARSIKDNRLAQLFYQSSLSDTGFRVLSCTIKVSGLTDGQGIEYVSNGTQQFVIMRIENDGIYHLPSFDFGAKNAYYGFKFLKLQESCNITIEQLPLYPGALVFDGVDDYGVCDNFPILTKEKGYTVVVLRQWDQDFLNTTLTGGLLSTRNYSTGEGVAFEKIESSNKGYWNLGAGGIIDFAKSPFTWQTSKQYNNVGILKGDKNHGKPLGVGCGLSGGQQCGRFAIWELVFLDHDATEEELTKIKDYFVKTYPWLFPDQAWTVVGKTNEDEDRATIANITGNGNDLVLSNFGFAEGSGYGLYKTPFELYPSVQHSSKYSLSFSKFALGDHNLIIAPKQNDLSYDIKVKVTGLKDGVKFKWGWIGTTGYIDITTDGIHMLNKPASQIRQLIVEFAEDFDPDHVVTIEQIPEYEGYLITDGVDDEIISAKLIQFADKFTIVGDWKFMEDRNDNAGLLKANQIYIYNATTGMRIYLKQGSENYPFSCKKINALTSDGWVYDEKWDKYKVYPIGSDIDISSRLFLGFYSSNFTKIALKNLGIYNDQLLSKDDCIKAYNYLQTLKAK